MTPLSFLIPARSASSSTLSQNISQLKARRSRATPQSVFRQAGRRLEPASLIRAKRLVANCLLHLAEAHLVQARLHDQLVEQVSALEVIQSRQVFQTVHLLVVQEQVHAVYSHGFKISAELHVPNYFNDVLQQALQAASLFDPTLDSGVKSLEATLGRGHLLLDPGCEVEAVVEDLEVGRARLRQRVQQFG